MPPGPFFAVWGVVVLGSVAAALWGLPLARATRAPWTAVQVPVSVAQTGFVVWLLAAATAPALTLPVFLVMLGVLTWSLRTVLRTPCDRPTRVLLGGTLGVYTGWSAAAVWLNGATLLPGDATVAWALLVTGAALTACAGARLFGGQLAFTLAAGWALLGVVVSTSGAGEPGLAALAAAGLATVAVTALASRTSAVPASDARAWVLSRCGRRASR